MTELKCITVGEAAKSLVIRDSWLWKRKKAYKQSKLQPFLGNGPKLEVEAKKRQGLSVEIQEIVVNPGTAMVITGSMPVWLAKAYRLVATRCWAL